MSDNSIVMSRSDMRIIKGMSPSKSDKLKNEKMFTNTIKKFMGAEIEVELDDGSKQMQPLVDVIVAKKIAYDLEHPEKINLKEYSQVLGEETKTVDVNIKSAKELFGDMVIDSEEDEENDYVDCDSDIDISSCECSDSQ